jgi:hypothetical protein
MQFQQLENIKSKHPSLSPQIDALANYISSELEEGRTRIVPALAAVYLKRSEAEATALLMLFEDARLLEHRFDIVCTRNDSILLILRDLADLQNRLPLHCQLCDCDHGDSEELRVDLVFVVTSVQVFKEHAIA